MEENKLSLERFQKSNLKELMKSGREIREKFSGKKIDLCTIVSGKTGGCPEDCKFCAQSLHRKGNIPETDLISREDLFKQAKEMEGKVDRFSIVSSGRSLEEDFDKVLEYYEDLDKEFCFNICASHGFLTEEQLKELKVRGVKRYHCNLETSQSFFPKICSTHDYQEKFEMIQKAQKLGYEICSGGIIGMGESFQDRWGLATTLKELKVDSVPINVLLPQKGTGLEEMEILSKEEILRTLVMFRHLLPETSIRFAAGRSLYTDFEEDILNTGIDGLMTGNLLTTIGSDLKRDREILDNLGYERK